MSRSHSSGSEIKQSDPGQSLESRQLIDALRLAAAYPDCPAATPVVVHETHVSWVFLAGQEAYKIKKPMTTGFLDYGTLAKREHYCHQELRLNRRYAPDLYLGVVPITRENGAIRVEGTGEPIEFAVKMRRFPEDALLSRRLELGKIANEEVFQLAATVAEFHRLAEHCDPQEPWGAPSLMFQEAIDNFHDLRLAFESAPLDPKTVERLAQLQSWTEKSYGELRPAFEDRREQGFIRECHGDLHLANVIQWQGRWTPFDGIEFNEAFRWIDVLSDAAFLAMDFAAQDHLDLERSFVNSYLEQTGDYASLPLLRWYLVYRAMVRAKVIAIRSQQPGQSQQAQSTERQECVDHIELAARLAASTSPRLWITYGVSGSGKTTGSEYLIQQHGAIRLRSDVERKRMYGLTPSQRPEGKLQERIYSNAASEQTYQRLKAFAGMLLRNGQAVVVDATFLRRGDREMFHQLATEEGARFAIVPFTTDRAELERRISERMRQNEDASDANLRVLQSQLETIEPLTEAERRLTEHPATENVRHPSNGR